MINLDNSDEEESDWRCNGQSSLSTHVKGKSLFGRRHNVQHKEGKDSTVVKVTTSLPPLEPRMAKYVIWVPTLTKEEDGVSIHLYCLPFTDCLSLLHSHVQSACVSCPKGLITTH